MNLEVGGAQRFRFSEPWYGEGSESVNRDGNGMRGRGGGSDSVICGWIAADGVQTVCEQLCGWCRGVQNLGVNDVDGFRLYQL